MGTTPAHKLLRGVANRAFRGWAHLVTAARRIRRHRRAPRLAVAGPEWFAALLEGEARIVAADTRPDVVLAGPGAEATAGETDGAVVWSGQPFVALTLVNPARPGRQPDGLPSQWAALAAAASNAGVPALAPSARPAEVDRWLEVTAAAHRNHRAALAHTSRDELAAALAAVRGERPVTDGCTVVCVTNRPHQLEQVIANYGRQGSSAEALIVVTNSSTFDLDLARSRLATVHGAWMIEADERLTLGACLNLALERVTTRYAAKFDDDDIYGEHFLSDLLLAHTYADAAVVGKHSHYVTTEAEGFTAVRFPGREYEYTSHLAGGTLVIDLERSGSVRFPDQTLGEDRAFIRRCALAGHMSFATDRFNYVQVRGADHTWDPGQAYMEGLHVVARDIRPDLAML